MSKENEAPSKMPLTKSTPKRNNRRQPLKTLNQGNDNLRKCERIKIVHRRDVLRHVTIKRKNEDLDWSYNVFKDDYDIIKESSVEELGERFVTLKPHSQEQEGISAAAIDDEDDEASASSSSSDEEDEDEVFTERLDSTSQADDFWLNYYTSSYNQAYGPELFEYLMMRDRTPQVPNISDSKRAAILNWILSINGSIGNPAVVQTVAWYLDALLSVTELNINKLQVVGVACYWIAMKIHGKSYSLKALVTIGGDAYSAKVLKFTERLVLRTLEFPIQPVVAQDFISYLSWECDATNYADIETAATMFYMAALVLQKSLKLYPTALAAVAAIRNALNMLHKQELLEKLANNAVYQAAKKEDADLVAVCANQTEALTKMICPSFKYRGLFDTLKDNTFTEIFLDYLSKNNQ